MSDECWECAGTEPKFLAKKCKEHDVCIRCKTPRADLTEIPWGHKQGIICKPCNLADQKARIAAFQAEEHDEIDFMLNSNIVCPFCGYENETDSDDYGNDGYEFERECGECDSTIKVEVLVDIKWSTSKPSPDKGTSDD